MSFLQWRGVHIGRWRSIDFVRGTREEHCLPRTLLCLLLVMLSFGLQADEPVRVTATHPAMGTEFSFILYGNPESDPEALRSAAEEAFAAIDGMENVISNWRENSEVSMLNRAEPGVEHPLSLGLFSIIEFSKGLFEDTGGVFDPTVGPLLELWGFYRKEGTLPEEGEVKQALDAVGLNHVRLVPANRAVVLEKAGLSLDFGGIGKGMALDVAAEVLKQNGVTQALLHSGTSTVLALGAPPGQEGWTVEIKDPYNKETGVVDSVALRDASLSTSAGYENAFTVDGKTYSHLFDPRTGYPAEGPLSATAIAPTGMESDALSTAFFVMGVEEVEAYCVRHERVQAILVRDIEGAPKASRINFNTERVDE